MKKVLRRIAIFWTLLFSFLLPYRSKAAPNKDINTRINKVRKALLEKSQKDSQFEWTGTEFNASDRNAWVNWGNWNNWANWANWNNWNNWGNWRNI
jgi:hypothetical protein